MCKVFVGYDLKPISLETVAGLIEYLELRNIHIEHLESISLYAKRQAIVHVYKDTDLMDVVIWTKTGISHRFEMTLREITVPKNLISIPKLKATRPSTEEFDLYGAEDHNTH